MKQKATAAVAAGAGHRVPADATAAEEQFLSCFPRSMTLITTYRCNAACRECCFESNPHRRGRLSLEQMIGAIDEAVDSFPALRLVVWSGGECFLLGRDLYAAIGHASAHGLVTRCVSNGFWGRSEHSARRAVDSLLDAGLTEINLSTGLEHQQWIPVAHVVRAARVCVESGISTLINVEKDTPESSCFQQLSCDPVIRSLASEHGALFSMQSATWMPFHADATDRGHQAEKAIIDKPCDQVLENLVVTPFAKISGCCGLTFEYIPEMKLGTLGARPLKEMFLSQLGDFLKLWIHMDGPYRVITRLIGPEAADAALGKVSHICQACVILHQHDALRTALLERWHEFVPEVMHRHHIASLLRGRAAAAGSQR